MSKAKSEEDLQISKENPAVTSSAFKVNYYHTTRCQFIENAKYPERVSSVSQQDIKWHDLDHCDDCKRAHKEGEWFKVSTNSLRKMGYEADITNADDKDRETLISILEGRGVSPESTELPEVYLENTGPSLERAFEEPPSTHIEEIKRFSVHLHADQQSMKWTDFDESVYYLPEHSKKEIIETWVEGNPDIVDERSDWSLHQLVSKMGTEWKEASGEIFDYDDDLPTTENAKSGGKICPVCGEEIDGMLPYHLRDGCSGGSNDE